MKVTLDELRNEDVVSEILLVILPLLSSSR